MPYTPYYATWEDDPSTDTPITAAALNNIEDGLTDAAAAADAAIQKSLLDAKGDLIVATGDDEASVLTVGADDEVPVAASGQSHGIIWQKIGNAQIATDAAIAQSKLSFDEFTAWTPTKITQDASDATNIAHTVNYGRYARIGNLVVVYLKATFTAAGTSGQTIAVQGLPVSALQTDAAVGSFRYSDSGTANYAGTAVLTSATVVRFIAHNLANAVGAQPAIAIASTDNIWFTITYEAA
jgi:hypothetical protein